jgi:hypothetical protein
VLFHIGHAGWARPGSQVLFHIGVILCYFHKGGIQKKNSCALDKGELIVDTVVNNVIV